MFVPFGSHAVARTFSLTLAALHHRDRMRVLERFRLPGRGAWLAPCIRGVLAVLLIASGSAPSPASAFVSYGWKSAVSGSADVSTNWTPTGLPTGADYVNGILAGTYTITFPAGVASTFGHSYTGGNITLQFSAPHTTRSFYVMPGSGSFGSTTRITGGIVNADYLEVNGSANLADFTLTGKTTEFHSHAFVGGNGNGDLVGNHGSGRLTVGGGARLYSGDASSSTWGMTIGSVLGSNGTVNVAGIDLLTLASSHLYMVGFGDLVVGASGNGTLNVTNGGALDADRSVYVGRSSGAVGTFNVGPGAVFRSTQANVDGNLGVGRSFFVIPAGRAEVNVAGPSTLRVGGWCEVGSSAGDQNCVLRVLQGAEFIGSGGLRITTATEPGLDLRGGITHVHGGAFVWPPARTLVVSSQVGTPELWIAGGASSVGPSTVSTSAQLQLGRGGSGALRVSGPGTVLNMGAGSTVLGDSLAGDGTAVVDSSAVLVSIGPLIVGNRGHGAVDVRSGAIVAVRYIYLGASGTGSGRITVTGAGSALHAVGPVDVGGGGIAAGTGALEVDDGGVVEVLAGGAGVPVTTIHAAGGTLTLRGGGRFTTTGQLEVHDSVHLEDGEIHANQINVSSSGQLAGYGRLSARLQNAARLVPASETGSFGTLRLTGDFVQTGNGHFHVKLGTTSAGDPVSDTLVASGLAALGGTLDLELDPSFLRTVGDTFTVLTCRARLGGFSSVTWNGNPLSGQAAVVYGDSSVRIAITAGTNDVGPGAGIDQVAAIRFVALAGGVAPAFELDLPEAARVEVRVFDVGGREVARLLDAALAGGRHRLDAFAGGWRPASGVYFARAVIRANGTPVVRTARAVLTR